MSLITITARAAAQIKQAAKDGRMEGMPLRIAAQHNPDGSLHYAMGFDDVGREDDLRFPSEDIEIVVSPTDKDLLDGMVVAFVELEPGQHNFIFKNPNDPHYVAPKEKDK